MNRSALGIQFQNYAGNRVNYLFTPEHILRESLTFTDTFQVTAGRFTLDSVYNVSRRNVFLRLSLQAEINQSQTGLRFYKRVYPNQMLQTSKP
jgi:hypothetical protein